MVRFLVVVFEKCLRSRIEKCHSDFSYAHKPSSVLQLQGFVAQNVDLNL